MKKVEPFFSIIIPTYNRASVIERPIRSIISQTYSNWELIIVDDGSTDSTLDKISDFTDPRIKYYHKRNEERSIARNYGIDRAIGKYICFLDSDDFYFSNHLFLLHKKIKEKEFAVGFFHTGIAIRGEKSEIHQNWFQNHTNKEVIKAILRNKPLYIQGISISKEILQQLKFPPDFSYWEDQHLWIRILFEYPFFSIEEITACWKIGPASSVNTFFQKDPLNGLREYLACISDAQNHLNREDRLQWFNAFEDYKLDKICWILSASIKRKNFILSLKQFLIGLKYVRFIPLTKRILREHF